MLGNILCFWFRPRFAWLDFVGYFTIYFIGDIYYLSTWKMFGLLVVYHLITVMIKQKYKMKVTTVVSVTTEDKMIQSKDGKS